jgi:hypothetical protein
MDLLDGAAFCAEGGGDAFKQGNDSIFVVVGREGWLHNFPGFMARL